ncbi:MAG: hypothetical protein ACQETH_03515 [Candidatus Rifleibacteriota bacterium]
MSARRFFKGILVILLFSILFSSSVYAELNPQYRRNGECYLLIGEGGYKGIYRLNNPEKDRYYSPPKYLFQPLSSIGFSVDLNRKIYTFSERVQRGFSMLSEPLKRQVLDSGSTDLADYGYHAYIHYDHRSWGRNTNVYRTGPRGRRIRRNGWWGRRWWPHFRSAGPGRPIPTPPGNPLPDVSIPLRVYRGKQWYEIPNGAWFSSWRTKRCQWNRPGPRGFFYVVYGDRVEGRAHNWTLYTYSPNNVNLDAPRYSRDSGAVVAVSYDKRIRRQIFAGCLDGCGGASGSGSGSADPMITDLAFMPPIKDQPSRTYFYSRPVGKTNYEITLNRSRYAPPAPRNNPIIGSPSRTNTYWIDVSMRNVTSDYIYTISTNDIKNWFRQATSETNNRINISAVTVSNQWNQKGGIVFAYDKNERKVYKFIRYEDDPENPPISRERYERINVEDLFSLIDADTEGEIDDIKADGFGNLYFAMSFPTKDIYSYNPKKHFELNDAIRVYPDPRQDPDEDEKNVWLIYCQEYAKAVFERSIYSSVPQEVGRKVFAKKYYNVPVHTNQKCLDELTALRMPSGRVDDILASYSADTTIGNGDGDIDEDDFSEGSLGLYSDLNGRDPGRAKIAVINVPTPPEVISLAGKDSFLDICGPYTDIPTPKENSTQQNKYLLKPAPEEFSKNTMYYFMVENYPMSAYAWNPNDQPDWDGDGRHGGFITSISDKKSSTDGGSVAYRWRSWLVEDPFGDPVCPPKPVPETATPRDGSSTGQSNITAFYSPVNGKFIITCQVIYDWYDYDLLPFGSTVDDKASVFRAKTRAKPVSPGGLTMQPTSSQLMNIMNTKPFKFMQASASEYISHISEKAEGDSHSANYACYPIVVAGTASEPPPPEDLIAELERCDGWDDNDPTNNRHWATAEEGGSTYHGLEAGKPYFWRINLASQSLLFADLSDDRSPYRQFLIDKMTTPEYEDGKQVNTMFVNYMDGLEFKDDPAVDDELEWEKDDDNPTAIELEAYLKYTVPDKNGDPKEIPLQLLDSYTNIPKDSRGKPKPIKASTPMSLPPTDPFYADLYIKMTRTLKYDLWMLDEDGYRERYLGKLKPLRITLYGKTKVLIVDKQRPKILYDKTKPINLFADAGGPIRSGYGPLGGNPASISFQISDNNPWESVDTVIGITHPRTYADNKSHNSGAPSRAPTSKFNYKPVFAKRLNRKVALSFDRAARIDTGGVKLFEPDQYAPSSDASGDQTFAQTFGTKYTHLYNDAGPVQKRMQRFLQQPSKTRIGDRDVHISTIGFYVPLRHLAVNSEDEDSNVLPKSYANNTPGYAAPIKGTPHIRPYKFYLSASDSSGNVLTNRKLNIALHPRDVHKPNPFAKFTEYKNNQISYFPILKGKADRDKIENSPGNPEECSFIENYLDQSDWIPDNNGVIKIKNQDNITVEKYEAMPQIGEDITFNFAGNNALAYYQDLANDKVDPTPPPSYIEDNVEFTVRCGVNDNAGYAVAKLTYRYLDTDGKEQEQEIESTWTSQMKEASLGGNDPKIASTSPTVTGIFRGTPDQFPMSIPVTIEAYDNAMDWDYYVGDGGELSDPEDPWSDWKWGSFRRGPSNKNSRTFKSSIPVYGTNLIIRTIDKGMRNK